ncbi:MAG: DUF1338 family protein [Gammaproteobacteria bacterium]
MTHLWRLMRAIAGERAASDMLDTLQIERSLLVENTGAVTRGVFAMALNAVLFHDLLGRVPTAAAYVTDRRRLHQRITFDHGALRTIHFPHGPTGELPPGVTAFARILEPLGYTQSGTYPLPKLRMTGRAFTHRDFPATLPQFFVSELHVERFSPDFQAAAGRLFGNSRDPLTHHANMALATFTEHGRCAFELAVGALSEIVAAFRRCHEAPSLVDYRLLLAESAEAAWMATEGCAFNHATDRVADVDATACEQRALSRPIKETVEVSTTGSVRQTAFKADPVARSLRTAGGGMTTLTVPGSFYEFISRDMIAGADGSRGLDLRFDSMNAQGIFKMTAAA